MKAKQRSSGGFGQAGYFLGNSDSASPLTSRLLLLWVVLVLGNLLWPCNFIISKDEHKGRKEQKDLDRNERKTEKDVLNSKVVGTWK